VLLIAAMRVNGRGQRCIRTLRPPTADPPSAVFRLAFRHRCGLGPRPWHTPIKKPLRPVSWGLMTESRRSTLLGTIESTPPSTRHSDQDNPSSFPLVLQSIPLPPRWACILVACPCRSHPSTAPAVPQPFAVSPWHCS